MANHNNEKTVSGMGRFLLGVYLALITAGLSYFTAKLWPSVAPADTTATPNPASTAAGTTGVAQNPPNAPEDKTGGDKAEQKRGNAAVPDQTLRRRQVRLFWGLIEFYITPEIRLILLVLAGRSGRLRTRRDFVQRLCWQQQAVQLLDLVLLTAHADQRCAGANHLLRRPRRLVHARFQF
jgi:hypothetical protein